jgi:hypothetical protein
MPDPSPSGLKNFFDIVSSTSAMIQIASDDDLQSGFAFGRFG